MSTINDIGRTVEIVTQHRNVQIVHAQADIRVANEILRTAKERQISIDKEEDVLVISTLETLQTMAFKTLDNMRVK